MSESTAVQHEHHEPPHIGDALSPDSALMRIQKPAFMAGIIGLALCLLGLIISRDQFFRAYLYSYMFWVGLPLGCLALLMLQHLTGGDWGLVTRRILEAGTRMIPLMAVLFIPIVLGMGRLYIWTSEGPGEVEHTTAAEVHHADAETKLAETTTSHDAQLNEGRKRAAEYKIEAVRLTEKFRAFWLTRTRFICFAVGYFAVWLFLMALLNKWSGDEDQVRDDRIRRRMQVLSGPGILIYGITVTLAVFDWCMSIDPHWYSTMYGLIFIVGQALSALSCCVLLLTLLAGKYPFSEVLTRALLNDLGNLMLAFIMLWAYLSFSQFLIMWSGNVAEETPYYVYRTSGGWKVIAGFLILLHWFLPFVILLSRWHKRNARILGWVAVIVLVMRFIDLLWVIIPKFAQVQGHHLEWRDQGSTGISIWNIWLYIAAPVGLGGIWLYYFIMQLKRRPLLPPNDYRLEKLHAVAAHGGAH